MTTDVYTPWAMPDQWQTLADGRKFYPTRISPLYLRLTMLHLATPVEADPNRRSDYLTIARIRELTAHFEDYLRSQAIFFCSMGT